MPSTSPTTPLNVLVTEPIMARFTDVLTRKGTSPHTWTFAWGDDPRLAEAAATAEVLVCSSTTAELLAAMPRLRLVHVTGAGVDRIPLDALPGDVRLANTYHHGRSIAEHVVMVSMMLLRGVLRSEADMRRGVWSNAIVSDDYPFGGVLAGRTLGIVGFGEIGSSVAR
ncbi:NAD(P)-dependent oxidoreductase, partial [Nocardioides sp. NPDC000441]